MWFSRSGSRRNTREEPAEIKPTSPSKPLLEPLIAGSANSSPTKSRRNSESPKKARTDVSRSLATPTITHDYTLTEVPSRLSASSSIGHGRPSLNIHSPNSLLQPPTARSQRHPSTVNLAEEELEGADRLFDPFTGKPVATLSPRYDASNSLKVYGSQLDIAGKQRNPADLEDPARQKMWDYLAKIRSLQAEVAAMHLAMDGHGLGDPWGARPGMHSRSGSVNYGKDAKSSFMDNASGSKVFETLPRSTAIAGDSDSDDEKKTKKNEKDAEAFVELNRMFERKQEALKAVTAKLRELSSVVRSYHELENPIIEPPTHQDAESNQDILIDSPGRKVLPPSTISQSDSVQEVLKPSPRPLLAVFTASPASSLASSSNPKLQKPNLLLPSNNTGVNRRLSLEMGAGGGRHSYMPPSSDSGPPLSQGFISRDQ